MTEVQFPISIGLVGAPGSGKSKVAAEFLALAEPYFEQHGGLYLISNAGDNIESQFDQAMGVFASYRDELWAFFNRLQREEQLRSHASTLSVGTAIDTLAHAGANMENMLMGIQTPELQERLQKQQIAMVALTHLFLENFRYTFGFYVPYKPGVILAGDDERDSHYAGRVDAAMQTIFANFGIRIQALDEPTIEEKAQIMFDTVKRIMESGAELPELPSVEDDSEIGDPLVAETTNLLAKMAKPTSNG